MNESLISKKEINQKIIESKNSQKNPRNKYLKDINIKFEKTQRMKMVYENSKEEKVKFVCYSELNIRKINYDKIPHQNRKKNCFNNLSKSNIYNKIKLKKFNFLLNMMISFIDIFLHFFPCEQRKFLFKSLEITVKIKGTGNIKIFSDTLIS